MAQLVRMDFRSRSLSSAARNLAALTALAAAGALVLEVLSSALSQPGDDLPHILWSHARYFTILTNVMVCLTFAGIVLAKRAPPPAWMAGLTLWITVTALVYHLLLSQTLTSMAQWADIGLHSVTPVLVVGWWLIFAPKYGLRPGHALLWLLWPLIYIGYALLRGHFDGRYPYFFIDPMQVGWDGVTIWSAIMGLGMFVGGLVFVGLGRAIRR
ncbi:Pr6Pr family membrane protein [Pseudooceanicola sp. HF7]|nr:Pr6Pr family membrane protein [Pseudooceanicola sp. HF7]